MHARFDTDDPRHKHGEDFSKVMLLKIGCYLLHCQYIDRPTILFTA